MTGGKPESLPNINADELRPIWSIFLPKPGPPLKIAFDPDFWRDPKAWPAASRSLDGRPVIFLLAALQRLGEREYPDEWPKIEHIYRRYNDFEPSPQPDWEESTKIHQMLYSFDLTYIPRKHVGKIDEESQITWYDFDENWLGLAYSLARNQHPASDDDKRIFADVLETMTREFARGKITTFACDNLFQELTDSTGPFEKIELMAWNTSKDISDKRFVFGQIGIKAGNKYPDDERGFYWIYIDEVEFEAFFASRGFPPPQTDLERVAQRLLELDRKPTEARTYLHCRDILLKEMDQEDREVSANQILHVFRRLKLEGKLKRLGRRGTKNQASGSNPPGK